MSAPINPETTVVEARRRVDAGEILLLDVREPEEWAQGHAEHAQLVPLGALDPTTVPTDRPVLLVCRSGGRSGQAVQALRNNGIDATNVAGGMTAWHQAGLPMVSDGPDAPKVV